MLIIFLMCKLAQPHPPPFTSLAWFGSARMVWERDESTFCKAYAMANLRELLKDNDGTFPYEPGQFSVTADMKKQFERDGYIIVRYMSNGYKQCC